MVRRNHREKISLLRIESYMVGYLKFIQSCTCFFCIWPKVCYSLEMNYIEGGSIGNMGVSFNANNKKKSRFIYSKIVLLYEPYGVC